MIRTAQLCAKRVTPPPQVAKRRKHASAWRQKELGYNARDQRLVLTTEDVAEALKEVSTCGETINDARLS